MSTPLTPSPSARSAVKGLNRPYDPPGFVFDEQLNVRLCAQALHRRPSLDNLLAAECEPRNIDSLTR